MKLTHVMSFLLLSLVSVFRSAEAREVVCNSADLHPLPTGHATVVLEAAVASRFLLLAKGTASQSAIVCTAALNPLGPCPDEGVAGDKVSVALLGATVGTISVTASKAIPENSQLYATAGGKVTDAVVTGAYWVGKSAPGSAALADGDILSMIPRFPRINP